MLVGSQVNKKVLAYVEGSDVDAGTVDIRYAKMYRCGMAPRPDLPPPHVGAARSGLA